MPNNALTTWECTGCKSGGKVKLNSKAAKESKMQACNSDNDDIIITGISASPTEKSASLAKLNEEQYKLILSPSGWLDCDIIHEVHVCLRDITLELRVYRDQLWVLAETLLRLMVSLFRFYTLGKSIGCV